MNKLTLENRLFIPNTAIPCKALISWMANQGVITVKIRKELSMIHIEFPDLDADKHEEAREFINNWLK